MLKRYLIPISSVTIIICLGIALLSRAKDQTDENTITAQEFRLVDKNGKTRAALGFTTDGYPILAFLNSKGKPYSYFTGTKIGSSIRFFDNNGTYRLSLGVGKNGNPIIILCDRAKAPRMLIGSNQSKNTYILLLNKNSSPQLAINVQNDNSHILFLGDNKEVHLALSSQAGLRGLNVFGNEESNNTLIGIVNGKPTVLLNRDGGKGVMLGYSRRDQPFVAVRHEDGIKWIQPRMDASDLPGLPQQLLELQDHLRAIGGR